MQPISPSTIEVRARFPQKGSYQVLVCSQDRGNRVVATFPVESTRAEKSTFPQVCLDFLSRGCQILKGDDQHLSSRRLTTLEIVVPGAKTVEIVDSHSNFLTFEKKSKR